jgi:hypothetical protein
LRFKVGIAIGKLFFEKKIIQTIAKSNAFKEWQNGAFTL